MKISRHPSDETLAAYAAGTLDEGSAFVVAAHLSLCRDCREAAEDFEMIGGALLAQSDSLALGRPPEAGSLRETPQRPRTHVHAPGESPVDRLIALYGQGRWKWRGFGVYSAPVGVPVQDGVRVFLLRAAAGTRMPRHSHTGVEYTLVLKGAFEHEFGRFGPGDLEEADGDTDHRPLVEPDSECICLVAMSGRLQLPGITGKLLQPFVRI